MGKRVLAASVAVLMVAVLGTSVFAAGETITAPSVTTATQNIAKTLSGVSVGNASGQVPVKLSVSHGSLSFGQSSGITFSPGGTTTGSTLYIKGTPQDVNAALATLAYTRSSLGSDTLEISLVDYGEVFFPDNGHLYEYVPAAYQWGEALYWASQRTKYGAQGYLATVTSQAENDFINDRLLGAGWMGAGDYDVFGEWRWVTGPEAGTQFWQGQSAGATVNGGYAKWSPGQPDNAGSGEHCAQFGMSSSLTGYWNDLPCGNYWLPGYVVEYGAPGDLPTIERKTMTIHTLASGASYDDGDGVPAAVEDAAPNGGDVDNNGVLDSLEPNVASIINPVDGSYMSLVVDPACSITALSVIPASSAGDSGYTYPYGMADFTTNCGTPGFTAHVKQYYFGASGNLVARKYNPGIGTGTYSTIGGATISAVTIGGQAALELAYQVTDGTALDQDGTPDGIIIDPAGLALVNAATAPAATDDSLAHTGQSQQLLLAVGVLAVLGGGIGAVVRRRLVR